MDDHQLRTGAVPTAIERPRDILGMGEGIAPPATGEPGRGQAAKAMIGKVEPRVLTGGIEMERDSDAKQLEHDRRELDRFGSGSDDETNMYRLQRSPWLRRRQCAGSIADRQEGPT
jgi:hypothetical protein